MNNKHTNMFRNPKISKYLAERIRYISKKEIKIMEVCGTHTVAIFRSGIRSLLPTTIKLFSGPGCPVCVTAQKEIDTFIMLARRNDVIITTFGDLIRVPGSFSTLQKEKANGADIRIVYSTFDALSIAKKNLNKKIIFLGIGFETTTPTIAAAIMIAKQEGVKNFYVISAHKLVPPVLESLAQKEEVNIDGLILPGHVSSIIGLNSYKSFFNQYQMPCVITGFEPTDLLRAIYMLVCQIESEKPKLQNAYTRAVSFEGNLTAMQLVTEIFDVHDSYWRGIGSIPKSGLIFKKKYAAFDAKAVFDVEYKDSYEPQGCDCGKILLGIKIPPQCSLYETHCTPATPIGPCMVSSEGTCATYYRYTYNNHDVLI
jgi:hydrogenase expression/formation protein HypD